MNEQSSVGLLASRARTYATRTFTKMLRRDGRIDTTTYREAAAIVTGLADGLASLGLGKGDRLVAYFDESQDGLWLMLACAVAGIVSVPLGPSYSIDALGRLVAQCGAKALFTTPSRVADVARLGVRTLVMDGDAGERIPRVDTADPLARLDALAEKIAPDDLYMLQQTSGSTGVPKLVMRKHVTMPYAGRIVCGGLTADDEDTSLLLTLSLTHGGAHYAVHGQIWLGGCLALPPGVDTGIRLEDAEALEPHYVFNTPRVLRVLLRAHQERYGKDAPSTPFLGPRLRGVNIGGAAPDQAMLDELARRRLPVCEAYGATEISLVAVSRYGEREPGWSGKVVPEVQTRIAEDGELRVKSPYRMAGFWGDEKLSAAAFDADGWYLTGDLALVEDGNLRILGRKRDVFNSSEGSNIYPVRLEELLESTPEIGQAFLVGDMQPYLCALVVPRGATGLATGKPLEPGDPVYAAIRARVATLNQGLERFETVRRVVVFDGPFDAAFYHPVGQGKVARDRVTLSRKHAALLAELYAPSGERFCV